MSDLALIDLSAIYWSAWHATADKELNAAFELTIATVQRHANAHKYCAVCCDAPPYWRKKIAPSYKAQRDAPEPNAIEQLHRTKTRLIADGFLLWQVSGYEADDVIATAVSHARSEHYSHDVTIVSGDKDLLVLVQSGVQQVKPNGGEAFDHAAVVAKFGVPPEQMRDLLALCGDTSDNIPGVPGVGPKTAAKLLRDFGDIDGLLVGLDSFPVGKTRAAIEANIEQLKLSRELVTLRTDVPMNFEDIYAERRPQRITEDDDMSDIDDTGEFDEEREAIQRENPPAEIVERKDEPLPKTDALAATNGNGSGQGVQVFEQGLQPGTLGAAYKLARGIAESRLYGKFPNAEAIWAVIIRGREMGIGALTALDSFHVIEGRPCPSAHLLIARAKQHPDCEYFQFISGDDKHAEYETKNRKNPKPTRLRYTLAQADLAGITKSQKGRTNWEKRPAEMLRKTAAIQLARVEYPEALLGAYAVEEME